MENPASSNLGITVKTLTIPDIDVIIAPNVIGIDKVRIFLIILFLVSTDAFLPFLAPSQISFFLL